MLKKECCKKCRKKIYPGWSDYDERVWHTRGEISCPRVYRKEEESITRDIKGKPPHKCPFYLENII